MHTFGLFVVKLGDENSVSTTDYLGSSGEVSYVSWTVDSSRAKERGQALPALKPNGFIIVSINFAKYLLFLYSH